MVWTPYIGEHLDCAHKSGNSQDPLAAVVQKTGEMQGGLEVPLLFMFTGLEELIEKAKKRLEEIG